MDPWISGTDLLANEVFCDVESNPDTNEGAANIVLADTAAQNASEVMSIMSGYTIRGINTATVWPESTCADYPITAPYRPAGVGVLSGYEVLQTRVALEWPVTEISEVVVGGLVLDPNLYEILDRRYLSRKPDADGGQQYWPISRVNDGSFLITYSWGVEPLGWMLDACEEVGVSLLRPHVGLSPTLPPGVSGSQTQGRSFTLPSTSTTARALRFRASPEVFPAVLRFLSLVNPHQATLPTHVWSPDGGFILHSVPA